MKAQINQKPSNSYIAQLHEERCSQIQAQFPWKRPAPWKPHLPISQHQVRRKKRRKSESLSKALGEDNGQMPSMRAWWMPTVSFSTEDEEEAHSRIGSVEERCGVVNKQLQVEERNGSASSTCCQRRDSHLLNLESCRHSWKVRLPHKNLELLPLANLQLQIFQEPPYEWKFIMWSISK